MIFHNENNLSYHLYSLFLVLRAKFPTGVLQPKAISGLQVCRNIVLCNTLSRAGDC